MDPLKIKIQVQSMCRHGEDLSFETFKSHFGFSPAK